MGSDTMDYMDRSTGPSGTNQKKDGQDGQDGRFHIDWPMRWAGKQSNLTTMSVIRPSIRVDMREFNLWARTRAPKQIAAVRMRALKRAGFAVMNAERNEVRRAFPKRAAPANYVSKGITYVAKPQQEEVWVGPFREGKKLKSGRVSGRNVADIIADHAQGSSFTGSQSSPQGGRATRLRSKQSLAIPFPAFSRMRGQGGKLPFYKVQSGLSAANVMGQVSANDTGSPMKSFRRKIRFKKGTKDVIAVRAAKPLSTPTGPWGFHQPSSNRNRGKKKRTAVSSRHPYVIPLMFLISRAKVKQTIRFAGVARKVAPRAIEKSFTREFNKELGVSRSL